MRTARVPAPMPTRLKIGNHSFRVLHHPIDNTGGPHLYGRTTHGRTTIEIDQRYAAAPSQRRDTLLHEVIHAVLNDVPHSLDDEGEEDIIRAVTPGLLAALRNNPKLVAYLTEK